MEQSQRVEKASKFESESKVYFEEKTSRTIDNYTSFATVH